MQIKSHLAELVSQAVAAAQRAAALAEFELPDIMIERPQKKELGDFATALPLKLARQAKRAPMQIAQAIVAHWPPDEVVAGGVGGGARIYQYQVERCLGGAPDRDHSGRRRSIRQYQRGSSRADQRRVREHESHGTDARGQRAQRRDRRHVVKRARGGRS